jgi:hypothetical protein
MLLAVKHSAQQGLDRTPLVALRLVTRNKFEVHERMLLAFSF